MYDVWLHLAAYTQGFRVAPTVDRWNVASMSKPE